MAPGWRVAAPTRGSCIHLSWLRRAWTDMPPAGLMPATSSDFHVYAGFPHPDNPIEDRNWFEDLKKTQAVNFLCAPLPPI
jgi:hypothetical protein